MSILIAEGDFTSRSMLAAVLRQSGHEGVETANDAEAREELQKPDASSFIILDRMMPGMYGQEALRRERAEIKAIFYY